jgi:PleD family two-component response regulator
MAHTKRLKLAWQIAVAKSTGFKPVSNQAIKQALRILIAENNPINQKVLACLLQPTGCQIDFVDNGLDAIAAVTRSTYDLVLVDMRTPKMEASPLHTGFVHCPNPRHRFRLSH